ncbi:aspartic peptidase A1 family protein [Tanacetum coccineum]
MRLITILLFIILVSLSHHVLSQDSFPFNTSVIPIYKDAKTSLHKLSWSIQLYTYQPYYLIDLDAPFTWTDCVVRPPPMDCGLEFACTWPLRCDDTLCKEAHSSDIYKALITSFSEATRKIPRVNTVKPFSLCLKSSAIRSIGTGFRVPKIDLETESGKNWTIYGGNSMKFTRNGTACFAFVDGGLDVKDPIVIGTFQMENNFMSFDLQNQRLGFSSSLLAYGTSCSAFNFTLPY